MENDPKDGSSPGVHIPDMSAAAITARLDMAGQLYELSRMLLSARIVEPLTTEKSVTLPAPHSS